MRFSYQEKIHHKRNSSNGVSKDERKNTGRKNLATLEATYLYPMFQ